jgi:hypothetical protein
MHSLCTLYTEPYKTTRLSSTEKPNALLPPSIQFPPEHRRLDEKITDYITALVKFSDNHEVEIKWKWQYVIEKPRLP